MALKVGRSYRGIEFVRLSDLPEDLKADMKNWINQDVLIKIKTDEALFLDCILLKDFQYWYDNIYTPVTDLSASGATVTPKRRRIQFAFER